MSQQFARGIRERIAQQQFLHIAEHRQGRSGVALAIQLIELRLDAIQPREWIT